MKVMQEIPKPQEVIRKVEKRQDVSLYVRKLQKETIRMMIESQAEGAKEQEEIEGTVYLMT